MQKLCLIFALLVAVGIAVPAVQADTVEVFGDVGETDDLDTLLVEDGLMQLKRTTRSTQTKNGPAYTAKTGDPGKAKDVQSKLQEPSPSQSKQSPVSATSNSPRQSTAKAESSVQSAQEQRAGVQIQNAKKSLEGRAQKDIVNKISSKLVNDTFNLYAEKLQHRLQDLDKKIQKLRNLTRSVQSTTQSPQANFHKFSDELEMFQNSAEKLKHNLGLLDQRIAQLRNQSKDDSQKDISEEEKDVEEASHSTERVAKHIDGLLSDAKTLKSDLLKLDHQILKFRAQFQVQTTAQPQSTSTVSSGNLKSHTQYHIESETLKQKLLDVEEKITSLNSQRKESIKKAQPEQSKTLISSRHNYRLQEPVTVHKKVVEKFSSEASRLKQQVKALDESLSIAVKKETSLPSPSPTTSTPNVEKPSSAFQTFLSEVGLLMHQLNNLDEQIVTAKAHSLLLSKHDADSDLVERRKKLAELRKRKESREVDRLLSSLEILEGENTAKEVDNYNVKDVQDCLDGDDSFDCFLLRTNALSPRKDRNLSAWHEKAASLHRVKRQSDTTTNNNDDCGDNEECGSGALVDIDPNIEREQLKQVEIQDSLTYNGTGGLTEEQIENKVKTGLERAFENVTGEVIVDVQNVTIGNNNQVTVKWQVTVKEDPKDNDPNSLFATNSKSEFTDRLKDILDKEVKPVYDNIQLGNNRPIQPFDPASVASSTADKFENPCRNGCDRGSQDCRPSLVDFALPICKKKCAVLEEDGQCQHGSICELDANDNAYCACGKNWEGRFCESRRKELSDGEIAGIAAGSLLALVGLIGAVATCCLCLWRRGQKDLKYTDFSDDLNGSDRYSNPSSKLSHFVIDRPHVSASPIRVFQPTPPPTPSGSNGRSSGANSRRFSRA